MKRKVIRNIPTSRLLLLLAQANALGCKFVDVSFYPDTNTIGVTPITLDETRKRFMDGNDKTSMEDIINDEQ